MRNRLAFVCAGILAVILGVGCTALIGLGDVPPEGPPDGSSPSDSGGVDGNGGGGGGGGDAQEASVVDAHLDASSDGAPVNIGALVLQGQNLKVKGITDDNYVIVFDNDNNSYYAVSLAGGPERLLYPLAQGLIGAAIVQHNLVFLYGEQSNGVSVLTLWSSSFSQPVTISNAAFFLPNSFAYAWGSADSQHFAYFEATNSTADVGTLFGVNGDGSNPTVLLSNVVLQGSCYPFARFAGGYMIVDSCSAADGGATETVQSFLVDSSWASSLVVPSSVSGFVTDTNGTDVVTAPVANGSALLSVFPIDGGGSGVTLDPSTPFAAGQFFATNESYPQYVVYNTATGAMKQASVSDPSPVVLVGTGVNYVNTLSPDQKWIVVSTSYSTTGFPLDLELASTTTAGPLQVLATSAEYGNLPLSQTFSPNATGFSTDGKYVIFYAYISAASGDYVGTLMVMPVGGPYTAKQVSSALAYDTASVAGSKILVLDNFQDDAGTATVDLEVADLSTSRAPQAIAQDIPREIAITKDLTKVVYAEAQGAAPGIYVAVIP